MKTTRAEITVSNGDVRLKVESTIRHELVKEIFEHLLRTVEDIDFNGHWKLENIFFFEEESIYAERQKL